MYVFLFKMLFKKNCTKGKLDVIISTCFGNRQSKWLHRLCPRSADTLSCGSRCILVALQLLLSLSKAKLESVCEFHVQRRFLSLKAARRTAARRTAARHTAAPRSRAHLHQPGMDRDDPSLMKVFSLVPWHNYRCYFVFWKRYPNAINALLSILGNSRKR